MMSRTTREVLEDHLKRRAEGDLAGDLAHNDAPDIVLLCKHGVFEGCDAIRGSARQLGLQVPDARFTYLACHTFEDHAFLEWRAESEQVRIDDGADSYVVRNGRIRVQTIHYTPVTKR